MKTSNLNQLDSLLSCGVSLSTLDVENMPTESATLSNKPTNKTKIAPRNYPHTPEQIAKELRIDEKGELWWRYSNYKRKSRNMNKPTGYTAKNGYKSTSLDGCTYLNSNIAWALYYGRWPLSGMVIDHINHNTSDDSKSNLREVTHAENIRNRQDTQLNNTSGVPGVCWIKATNKWRAVLKLNSKTISGGHYEKFEDAVIARRELEVRFNINATISLNATGR